MQTLPQPHAQASATPLPEIGTAQHAALLRWHSFDAVGDVMDAIARHPHYPCIAGDAPAPRHSLDRVLRPSA